MAIQYVDSVAASNKTSGTTLVRAPVSTIPVGSLVVAVCAADNLSATTPTFTLSDTKSNSWTTVIQGAVNATAEAGVAGAIAYSKLTTALTTSDSVTMTLSGAVVAKAMWLIWFSGASNLVRGTSAKATGASTSPSVTTSAPLINDLVVGGLALESSIDPSVYDSDTAYGSWSIGYATGPSGGSPTSNVKSVLQYKVVTGTASQTWNLTTANTEWVAMAVAFIPAWVRTATGSGTGSSTAPFTINGGSKSRTATGSGTGTASAPRKLTAKRTSTSAGTGTSTATRKVTTIRTATASGAGTSSTAQKITRKRTATGSGTGDSTASWLHVHTRAATGSGTGTSEATATHSHPRTATGSGVGSSTATRLITTYRSATGSGQGGSIVVSGPKRTRTATGSGAGSSTADGARLVARTATGQGAGDSTATPEVLRSRQATGAGTGTSLTTYLVTVPRSATGAGTGTSSTTYLVTVPRSATGSGYGTSATTRRVIVPRTATGAGDGSASVSSTYLRVRAASGVGTSSSAVTWRIVYPWVQRTATGQGVGSSTVIGGKTVYLYYTLREWREAPTECFAEPADLTYVEPSVVEYQTA